MGCGLEYGVFSATPELTCGEFGFYRTCDGKQRAVVKKIEIRREYDNGSFGTEINEEIMEELTSCK
jgi:hypothetical protein